MFKTSYRYLGDIFQTVLYLVTLFAICFYRIDIKKSRVFQLFLISIIIQIISWSNLSQLDPTYKNKLSLTWLGYFFIFFIVAFWLKGDNKKINLTMISFVIGTILTCLLHSNSIIYDYSRIINGYRTDYNFMNANHSAALLSTSLIIITYLISTIRVNIIKLVPLLILTTITIFLLMGTQSRSAYVSLAIPLLILVRFSFKKNKINFLLTTIITLGVTSSFFYSSLPRVGTEVETFQKEYELSVEDEVVITDKINRNQTVSSHSDSDSEKSKFLVVKTKEVKTLREKTLVSLDNISNKIPYTSVGFRLHFWIDTIKQSIVNPIFGLGNNANKYILENSVNAKVYQKHNFQHLHSSYMELIASYGLVGIILLAILYTHVFKIARNRGSRDIFIFAVCLYSFLGVLNLFESYLFVKSGVLIHTLALGVLYSYNFKGDIENENK
ncbi:O-antigen ligase family protein [Vibrio splendidus]|uniref:O-antigen ligase family protein n=1 Tax=Vibrio splendidus TaxID=29497 RepID=UPI001F51BCE6|nr:O-antigen ligase family protein [Vibrio splendidus]